MILNALKQLETEFRSLDLSEHKINRKLLAFAKYDIEDKYSTKINLRNLNNKSLDSIIESAVDRTKEENLGILRLMSSYGGRLVHYSAEKKEITAGHMLMWYAAAMAYLYEDEKLSKETAIYESVVFQQLYNMVPSKYKWAMQAGITISDGEKLAKLAPKIQDMVKKMKFTSNSKTTEALLAVKGKQSLEYWGNLIRIGKEIMEEAKTYDTKAYGYLIRGVALARAMTNGHIIFGEKHDLMYIRAAQRFAPKLYQGYLEKAANKILER